MEAVEPNYIYSLVGETALRKNINKPKDPNPEDFQDLITNTNGIWRRSICLRHLQEFKAMVQSWQLLIQESPTKTIRVSRVRDLNETQFIHPYDFVDNDSHANDDHGHGTHVAGTIAQSTNNGLGVVGVAPGAHDNAIKGIRWLGTWKFRSYSKCYQVGC